MFERYEKCLKCTEPTKRVCGFYDGIGKHGEPISGPLYDCKSTTCPIKQEAVQQEQEHENHRRQVDALNKAHCVDLALIRKQRLRLGITLRDAARYLGVKIHFYSAWENAREAFPPEMYKKLSNYLSRSIELVESIQNTDT